MDLFARNDDEIELEEQALDPVDGEACLSALEPAEVAAVDADPVAKLRQSQPLRLAAGLTERSEAHLTTPGIVTTCIIASAPGACQRADLGGTVKLSGLLKGARQRAGLTMEQLEERTGISQSQVSKVERDKAGMSLERVVLWLDACDHDLAAVPRQTPTDLAELGALSEAHRAILIRLGRILPRLIPAHLSTLLGLLDLWEREGTQPLLSSRAESSQARVAKSS